MAATRETVVFRCAVGAPGRSVIVSDWHGGDPPGGSMAEVGAEVGDAGAVFHVCVTCRAGLPLAPGGVPMGADLLAAMQACVGDAPPAEAGDATFELRGVECLAMCALGCSAAISGPGKWSYLLGGLTPAMAADLVAYGRAYVASSTGTIMPSRRAASLKDMIVGRVPALDVGRVPSRDDARVAA